MNLGLGSTLLPGDHRLIDHIVGEVKSQGIFDQFRKECIADVDTKPAYQNLRTRVESSVNSFLSKQRWRADLNKNQLRETLRKHISDGPYLDTGVERIVDQVVNPKIYSVFMPQVEDVVYEFMGLEKPKRAKNGPCGFKDLLPKDLDPVSPESDKNSLKDVSLDSVDANLTVPGEEEDLNIKNEPEELETKVEVKTEEFPQVENEFSNGRMEEEVERLMGEPMDLEGNTPPHPGLNDSIQSEEKEEEEEDSPVFEPIDIMNLNESNISNDSHLSGISELTSHRSRSPDFSNDFSRDNFDFSNHDSQLSKVSSDSRLSIVTDFGSSNQQTTPVPDLAKDENSKDKFAKDNFKAIRGESEQNKDNKIVDVSKQKENLLEMKDGSDTRSSKTNLSSKESSRDGTESIKEKSEHKSKEKTRDSGKSKSSKERSDSRESRSHRDKDRDKRKSNHNESKSENLDKSKSKDKSENSRDSTEKFKEIKEIKENKDTPTKLKEEKSKESPSKEGKDLKDIYKEKIRELREKKELTEKEKFIKESKEYSKDDKSTKDSKEKRDSSRDKKKHRSSSSRTHSSSRHESKSSKSSKDDTKTLKSDSRDKTKRDENYRSKDGKSRSQSESNDKLDKSETKKISILEKDEKSDSNKNSKSTQKSTRKDSKSDSKSSEKSEKRDNSKDKKRKDEKKPKSKDDHSSLRKGFNDRRSSDRDGSSGSSGRGSQKSNSSPSTSASKPSSSSLAKDSSTNSNSSSETSDGIDETQTEEFKPSESEKSEFKEEKCEVKVEKPEVEEPEETINPKLIDPGQSEISLPLKKRPLLSEDVNPHSIELPIKKPKFARNFAEAKKLMKIRKRIEKEKLKSQSSADSRSPVSELSEISEAEGEILPLVPDDERVQIIEVKVDDEDEPYPGTEYNLTLDESSKIILPGDEILNTEIVAKLKTKSTLSEMELSIRQSLNELISDKTHGDNTGKIVEPSSDAEEKPSTSQAKSSDNTDNTAVEQIESSKVVAELKEEIKSNEEESKANPDELSSKSSVKSSEEEKEERQGTLEAPQKSETLPGPSFKDPELSDDEEDCRYFIPDNERLNRFTEFLNSLDLRRDSLDDELEPPECRTMAPPQAKRKYSTSPLSDILLNNSNNNNDGHKMGPTIYEEVGQSVTKKTRMGRPKKQRLSVSSPSRQMMNGENFVLPMSPESDVSATSDKNSISMKEERRPRGSNQRYTSDDLYKPRPLFASSSRRSRRSNP